MEKVEQILETLADSPQVIVLITVSGMVLIAPILSVLIGMHIIKLIKTMKIENKENAELIMKLFSERWDRAEAMLKTKLAKTMYQSQRNHKLLAESLLSQWRAKASLEMIRM